MYVIGGRKLVIWSSERSLRDRQSNKLDDISVGAPNQFRFQKQAK